MRCDVTSPPSLDFSTRQIISPHCQLLAWHAYYSVFSPFGKSLPIRCRNKATETLLGGETLKLRP